MAGDWLKFDKATPDKPEVFAIATDLGIDPDAVVGKLMRVWSWFDSHTADGNAPCVAPALLDRCAGVTGFVAAMEKSGWIVVQNGGCKLPNFDRHCGSTAKNRALGAKRSAAFRGSNAPSVTTALPREEKRREEVREALKATVQRAAQSASRFPEFWKAYPNKQGKASAEKKWRSMKLDAIADTIIAHVQRMTAHDDGWQRGYIPQGSTYINGQRWSDEPKSAVTETAKGPGKQMQTLNTLQEMRDGMAGGRGNGGFPAFGLLGNGSAAGSGGHSGNGNGLV